MGIPGPISSRVKDFRTLFKNLDTSLIDLDSPTKDLWFLENMEPEIRDKFKEQIAARPDLPYQDVVADILANQITMRETSKSRSARIQKTKILIRRKLVELDEKR